MASARRLLLLISALTVFVAWNPTYAIDEAPPQLPWVPGGGPVPGPPLPPPDIPPDVPSAPVQPPAPVTPPVEPPAPPVDPAGPPTPPKDYGNALPPVPKDCTAGLALRIEDSLAELKTIPLKGFPPNPSVSKLGARLRQLRDQNTEMIRYLFKREAPVWVIENGTTARAAAVAKSEMSVITEAESSVIDVPKSKASIDALLDSVESYSQAWKDMLDRKYQAELRRDMLDAAITKIKNEHPGKWYDLNIRLDLPVVKNGELEKVVKDGKSQLVLEPYSFSTLSQLRAALADEKSTIRGLNARYNSDGSFRNVAKSQVANIEMLTAIRQTFDKAINEFHGTPSEWMKDTYLRINKIVDRDTKVIAKDFSPPPEAFDKMANASWRAEAKSISSATSTAYHNKLLLRALANSAPDGVRTTAPSSAMSKLLNRATGGKLGDAGLDPELSATTGAAADPSLAGNVNKQPWWFRAQNFVNNVSDQDRAIFHAEKLTSYAQTFLTGSKYATWGGAILGGLGVYNGSLSAQDALHWFITLKEQSLSGQFATCSQQVDEATFANCMVPYIQNKFLAQYVEQFGLKDGTIPKLERNAFSLHNNLKTVEIYVGDVPSHPTKGPVYRDAKDGSLYLRPELSPADIKDQPGVSHVLINKTVLLKIDPKELPMHGSGAAIERNSSSSKVYINAKLLLKKTISGTMVVQDGVLKLSPAIEAEEDRLYSSHLKAVKDHNAKVVMELQLRANMDFKNPCSQVSMAKWIKADEATYQSNLLSCLDRKFPSVMQAPLVKSDLSETLAAQSKDRRGKIDKLVKFQSDFGNFVCSIMEQHENAKTASATATPGVPPVAGSASKGGAPGLGAFGIPLDNTTSPGKIVPTVTPSIAPGVLPFGNTISYGCGTYTDPDTYYSGGYYYGNGMGTGTYWPNTTNYPQTFPAPNYPPQTGPVVLGQNTNGPSGWSPGGMVPNTGPLGPVVLPNGQVAGQSLPNGQPGGMGQFPLPNPGGPVVLPRGPGGFQVQTSPFTPVELPSDPSRWGIPGLQNGTNTPMFLN